MTKHNPPANFVADAVALDFLNSLATPVDTPFEWINDGKGLIQWLREAGLVSSRRLDEIERVAMPGELDNLAAQARSLREWFRGFVSEHKGQPLNAGTLAELGPLNRLLSRDEQFKQIVEAQEETGATSGLEWSHERQWKSPEALLSPIAEAMGELVCTDDFSDIKACEGHNCTIVFIDRTRGRRRRWCSMAVCGNRAKQAAHRARAN